MSTHLNFILLLLVRRGEGSDGYDSAPRTGHSRSAPSTSASGSSASRVNHLFFDQEFFYEGEDLMWTICETS